MDTHTISLHPHPGPGLVTMRCTCGKTWDGAPLVTAYPAAISHRDHQQDARPIYRDTRVTEPEHDE